MEFLRKGPRGTRAELLLERSSEGVGYGARARAGCVLRNSKSQVLIHPD